MLTPDELRQLLEAAVPPHSQTVSEVSHEPLVELAQDLAQLPVTELSEAAFTRIEQKLKLATAKPTSSLPRYWWLGVLAIVVMLGGILVMLLPDNAQINTPVPATQTLAPTRVIPSITPTRLPSTTPTQTLVPSSTVLPSATAIPPSLVPTTVQLILEGPIEAIQADTLTIYNITLRVSPDLLAGLQVGDMVRIEAVVGEEDVFIVLSLEPFITPTPPNAGGNLPSGGDAGGGNNNSSDDDDDD